MRDEEDIKYSHIQALAKTINGIIRGVGFSWVVAVILGTVLAFAQSSLNGVSLMPRWFQVWGYEVACGLSLGGVVFGGIGFLLIRRRGAFTIPLVCATFSGFFLAVLYIMFGGVIDVPMTLPLWIGYPSGVVCVLEGIVGLVAGCLSVFSVLPLKRYRKVAA